jgi:RHS repeat-associated protein
VSEQKQLVSGPVSGNNWIETDYASFYANGSPGTTTVDGVQLAPGGGTNNLTETATYDPFGNLLTQTDWSNSRVTETDSYDIAGQMLTSTDAYGITSNSNYDSLGNVTASWKSVSGTSQKDDWTTTTYDPMGRALIVTTKLSDASGNPTTQDVTTNTWDGVGNELTSSSSTMGGQPAAWTYDDQGHATSTWVSGVYSYASGRATQDSYDDQGNLLSETVPGNSNATTYTYNPDGSVAQQNNPDGSFVAYGYDQNGNKTSQTVPMSGYSQNNANVATTNYAYDYANRLTSTTEPNSFATTNGYDELSRLTGAQGSGNSSATNTTYNNLGWVLQKVDADGVTDSKTYNADGCVTAETIGSKTTSPIAYNADNQLTAQTDADGNLLTNIYDQFGNLTEAKHTNGSTVLKDVQISPDSLGRPILQKDTATGISHSWTYPTNAATGIQETVNYDATPLTKVVISRDARNMENQRVAQIGTNNTVTWAISDPSGRDNADRWVAATLQQTGGTQLSEGRSFDAAGRLSGQSGAGYTSGNSASYAYDPDSGLLAYESLPLLLGGTVTEGTSSSPITYDANQRIATASVNGVAGSYTFDGAGNLKQDQEGPTTTNFTYNGANQLTQSVTGSATTVYGWDATNAWRTSQGPSGTPNQIQYAYNAQGRMKSYTNSATGVSATYSYDAAGQRTQSAVTVGGTTTTTTWVYEGQTLLSQQVVSGSNSWRVDYLYNENGTPIGGVYRSPATSSAPVFFAMITNSHSDVCELLDANGNAFGAYHYDAWGMPQGSGSYATGIWTASTSLVGSTLAGQIASRQALRYASYVYDPESGLYYCSARYYDPGTRQWTTADSAKADGEESEYQYCRGDPIGKVDGSGLYAHAFVPTAHADQTEYFLKVMQVDAGRVVKQAVLLNQLFFESWFYESVRTHAAWDLKWCMGTSKKAQEDKVFTFFGRRISLDDFGNIHFGYISCPIFGSKGSVVGAGVISVLHGKSAGKIFNDEKNVEWGCDLFQSHGFIMRPSSQIDRFICPGYSTVWDY